MGGGIKRDGLRWGVSVSQQNRSLSALGQGAVNDGVAQRAGAGYHFGMTYPTFRDLLFQRPFKPFRVVMSSGKTYDVRHPEMALLTRSDLLVGIDDADDEVPADFKICALLHVTAVEPVESAPAEAKSNGTA